MIDSMQDAVVAVDVAGRIQWTNQRMQRLMPGSSASGAIRIGHSLVQTIRDPDVLACVRTALEQRIFDERRSTSLLPGRIFEVRFGEQRIRTGNEFISVARGLALRAAEVLD